ncbi:MAG: YkoF family thiamine/hydroxymethylpyrimidine-binding protein [Flavobacteriaceae bacterium]|tara:strand:+ start:711 stop:971 length:261 start_codon:yes stop_codon:yes gene_type:complete
MKVSVEITLIPIKKNYISTIKKFIKTIRDSGFKVIENPLSTQIYGDYDLLMSYLNREIKNVFDDKDHIIVQLKLFNVDRSNYSPDF